MEINKIKSDLKMNNLYFSKCMVERKPHIQNGNYTANLERTIEKIRDHEFDIQLRLTIEKEDLTLIIVANANFVYTSDDYTNEENLIKTNTVAIMFPFMRSQVTLLTTQPGMTPIVLPPINTTKLM